MADRGSKDSDKPATSPLQTPVQSSMPRARDRGIGTIAVHGGEARPKLGNALATPIVQTATYTFANTDELRDHFERRIEREEYGRYGNPTQRIAEQKLAELEGAEDCLLFASGMAAITTTLFAVYCPQIVRHRREPYAASAAGESWLWRTAAGVWNPCRSMSQVVL